MLVGIERHQHIIAGLCMQKEVSLCHMNTGIKAELAAGSLYHVLGQIQAIDLTSPVFKQIQKHGTAPAADIQHTGAAAGNGNRRGDDTRRPGLRKIVVPIGRDRVKVFGNVHGQLLCDEGSVHGRCGLLVL